MKYCGKCKETKSFAEFNKNSSKRDGLDSNCKVCANIKSAKYRTENPGKVKSAKSRCVLANPDKYRAIRSRWTNANPEKDKASKAKWAAANIEKAKAISVRWAAANPQRRRVQVHNYRASKRESGKLSPGLSDKLFKLQRGKCACCGKSLGKDFHLDHIMPVNLGGSNTDDNIQLLRATCNRQKSAKHPVDFMRRRGFLL